MNLGDVAGRNLAVVGEDEPPFNVIGRMWLPKRVVVVCGRRAFHDAPDYLYSK